MGVAAAAIAAGTVIQAYGTYQGLMSAAAQADYQAEIDRNNAEIKKQRIKDIAGIGAREAVQIERETGQFIGKQVTAFASGNIDISSAVVGEAIEETARTGAADIIELQHNIEREIWGLEVGILSDTAKARLNRIRARQARKLAPISTGAVLLGGSGSLLGGGAGQVPRGAGGG